MRSGSPITRFGIIGALLALGGLLSCPPVLGLLATADGVIDNEWLRFVLWPGSIGCALSGLAVFALAMSGRLRTWVGRHRTGVAVGIAVALCLCWAGFEGYVHLVNRVDLLARLAPQHVEGQRLLDLRRTLGSAAALEALLDHSRSRPAAVKLLPLQLWHAPMAESVHYRELALSGNMGGSSRGWTYLWSPGERIPWAEMTGTVAFMLQRHQALFHLLRAADPEHRQAVHSFAVAYVDEWRRANRVWTNWNTFAWNDDAMSYRIQAQIWLMDALRRSGSVSREQEQAFLESLIQHADRLADPAFYTSSSNHGMSQNEALLSIAVGYPEFDRGGLWRRTALQRTVRYVQESVTSHGAFLELAPGYHWHAMKQSIWFAATCKLAGIPVPAELERATRNMASFSHAMLQPDRSLPMIADTFGQAKSMADWPFSQLPKWPELRSLTAGMGRDSPPNQPGANLFADSGFFILRAPAPTWSTQSALMLVFGAGPISRAHAHPNQLSVTLYGHGRALLSGPGYPTFAHLTERKRLIATVNQNTVTVDGNSQPLGRAKVIFSDIRPRQPFGVELAIVQAESLLYEGVVHRRTVLYGPAADSVLLIDELSSQQPHDYRQHFRLSKGVTGAVEGGLVQGSWAAGGAARLQIHTQAIVGAKIVQPQGLLKSQVASFLVRHPRVTFVTRLWVGPGTPSVQVDAQGGLVTWTGAHGRLSVQLSKQGADRYSWSR